MRFIVDECTGPSVAAWLRQSGHDVFSVYDEARGADDDTVIQKAFAEAWVLITNDKDFGEKVFREERPHRGIILLRLKDERTASKIAALQELFENYQSDLGENFVVVTEEHVRFAKG